MKYNDIMENVEVTSEMRERILANISKRNTSKTKPVSIFSNWKLLTTMAACVAIVVLCITVLPNVTETKQPEDSVSVVNGIVDCENLAELSQKAGFDINELTNIPFDVSEKNYSFWFGETAQINYIGANNSITYRVAEGGEDISGDYNEYSEVREEVIQGTKVTIKGNDDKAYLAIWSSGNHSYSIGSSEGITYTEMLLIIEGITRGEAN